MLLTACAGPDGGIIADAAPAPAAAHQAKASAARAAKTSAARPAKASIAKAEARAPAGASITTASIDKTKAVTVVDLPYRPAVGSRWNATSELRETRTVAGRVTETLIARDRGEYRVAIELEKGYRIAYTLHDGSIEGNTPLADLMRPLVESMKGQSFAYETDEAGIPVRVLDVDRWKALAVKAIDTVAQSKPEFSSVPQLQQFVDGIRARYEAATPESGVELFLEPLARYTMLQGLKNLTVGEERSYDDEVVNPLTGTTMRAKGFIKVASVDRASGLATIQWRQTIEPEDLNKAVRDFIKGFMPNDGEDSQKFLEAMAKLKIDHTDQASYKVALADGVVRRMDRTTLVKTQGSEKKTVTVMTMTPAR
jgi:hypothetical protein